MISMLFGLLIRAYREKCGLSVRLLAHQIGVGHTALFRFERGQTITTKNWVKIIKWAITEEV